MAFEGLTQRLQQAFGKVRGKGSLTEEEKELAGRRPTPENSGAEP